MKPTEGGEERSTKGTDGGGATFTRLTLGGISIAERLGGDIIPHSLAFLYTSLQEIAYFDESLYITLFYRERH